MSFKLDANESDLLSRTIGEIYDCVLDQTLWPVALEHACAFVGGIAANIFWQDAIDQSALTFHSWGDDPVYVARYFETYAKLNPLFPALTFVQPGVVFAVSDLVPIEEFVETRFFKEWVRPQGYVDVVAANIQRYATSAASFSIRRGQRHGLVDSGTRARMKLLVPHVQRAVLIGREIDQQKAKALMLADVLDGVAAGVFLVDHTGRLSLTNDAGRLILEQGDLLSERNGLLTVRDPSADRMLRTTLSRIHVEQSNLAPSQVSIVLTGRGTQRWLAHVLPLSSGARLKASLGYRATAAVFVRRAELPIVSGIEAITKVYGLTPSEMRVLQAVVSEGRVTDIARTLGVSVSTTKTHLASLFAKTGTNRRTDLVKAVASHGNPLA